MKVPLLRGLSLPLSLPLVVHRVQLLHEGVRLALLRLGDHRTLCLRWWRANSYTSHPLPLAGRWWWGEVDGQEAMGRARWVTLVRHADVSHAALENCMWAACGLRVVMCGLRVGCAW